jgi:excisionase family DNA binding protein
MLTTQEAAAFLNVSSRFIRMLISSGKLKAEKKGRDWDICEESLHALKKEGYGQNRKP